MGGGALLLKGKGILYFLRGMALVRIHTENQQDCVPIGKGGILTRKVLSAVY